MSKIQSHFNDGYKIPEKFQEPYKPRYQFEDLIDYYRMVHDGIGLEKWWNLELEKYT